MRPVATCVRPVRRAPRSVAIRRHLRRSSVDLHLRAHFLKQGCLYLQARSEVFDFLLLLHKGRFQPGVSLFQLRQRGILIAGGDRGRAADHGAEFALRVDYNSLGARRNGFTVDTGDVGGCLCSDTTPNADGSVFTRIVVYPSAISMLLLPVVRLAPASMPIATLSDPVVLS